VSNWNLTLASAIRSRLGTFEHVVPMATLYAAARLPPFATSDQFLQLLRMDPIFAYRFVHEEVAKWTMTQSLLCTGKLPTEWIMLANKG